MSLFDIFGIASSGLAAQSQRLNVVASNLANADAVAGSADAALVAADRAIDTGDIDALVSNLTGQIGAGIALTMSPMSTAAMNAVSAHKAGIASGILQMSRMIGGAVGVVVDHHVEVIQFCCHVGEPVMVDDHVLHTGCVDQINALFLVTCTDHERAVR